VSDLHIKSMTKASIYHIRQKIKAQEQKKERETEIEEERENERGVPSLPKEEEETQQNREKIREEQFFLHISEEEEEGVEREILEAKSEFEWATSARPNCLVLY